MSSNVGDIISHITRLRNSKLCRNARGGGQSGVVVVKKGGGQVGPVGPGVLVSSGGGGFQLRIT